MAKNPVSKLKHHRSVPIAESKVHIAGYPKKLTLYKSNASPFYWVRYYAEGKILRKSTKTESKREAIEFAKEFYDQINFERTLKQMNSAIQQRYQLLLGFSVKRVNRCSV